MKLSTAIAKRLGRLQEQATDSAAFPDMFLIRDADGTRWAWRCGCGSESNGYHDLHSDALSEMCDHDEQHRT